MTEAAPMARTEGMSRLKTAAILRWTVAIAVAAAVHGLAYLTLSVEPDREIPVPLEAAPIYLRALALDEKSNALREQILLFDTGPLFLPTQWNYATAGQSARNRAPGEIFLLYPPEFAVQGAEATRLLSSPPVEDRRPVALVYESSLQAFGRQDGEAALASRAGGAMEVREMGTGQVVFTRPLPVELMEGRRLPDWQPAEFVALIQAEGLAGTPQMTRSSGVEAIDRMLGGHMESLSPMDWNLPPGVYRVVFGP